MQVKTRHKWLIFWGVLASLIAVSVGAFFFTNVAEIRIPFEKIIPPKEKDRKKVTYNKVKNLTISQQVIQTELQKVSEELATLNEELAGTPVHSLLTLSDLISKWPKKFALADEKEWQPVLRELSLVGQSSTSQIHSMTLVDYRLYMNANNEPETELGVNLNMITADDSYQILPLSLRKTSEPSSLHLTVKQSLVEQDHLFKPITPQDEFLEIGDGLNQINQLCQEYSDPMVFKEAGGDKFNPNYPDFKSLVARFTYGNQATYEDLFQKSRGNLTRLVYTGIDLTNEPDGTAIFELTLPLEKGEANKIYSFKYNRLDTESVKLD